MFGPVSARRMAGPAGRKVRTVYLCVLYLASLGYDRVWEAIDLGRKLRSALFPNPDDCYSWQLQFFLPGLLGRIEEGSQGGNSLGIM